MDEYCKRSGQIPAFGDWDNANELPITQYFECARQAGLIRFSSSSGESNPYVAAHDLYETANSRKHSRNLAPPRKQASRVREKGGAHVKEQKKAGRVCDVTEPPRKYYQNPHHHLSLSINNDNTTSSNSKHLKYDAVPPPIPKRLPVRPPKPVDEDLYKIPLSSFTLPSERRCQDSFPAWYQLVQHEIFIALCFKRKGFHVYIDKDR